MSQEHHITQTMVPLSFEYKYHVGQAMERFLAALSEGKILGVKCPGCGRVVVPPRQVCGACNVEMTEWVEVGREGTLENYTVARVVIKDGEIADAPAPYVIGQIRLDGADSLLTAKVEAADLESLAVGMRVRAIFAAQPKGTVHDLDHFDPIL